MLSQMDSPIAVLDEEMDITLLDAIWQQLEQALEAEKERIVGEIGRYPRPISACDAQFNGLLEDRVAILQELGQVNEMRQQGLTGLEQLQLLNDFMLASRYHDREVEGKIRQLMVELSSAA